MTTGVNQPNNPAAGGAPSAKWPYTSQRLAEELVAQGYLPAAAMSDLIAHATSGSHSLVDAAVERGAMEPDTLRDAMSRIFAIPTVDLESLDETLLTSFPRGLAQRYVALPVEKHDDRYVLAVYDPTRSRSLRELRAALGLPFELRLATRHELLAIIHRVLAPRLSAKFSDGTKVDFVVPPTGAKIGRADSNDLILRDPSVSSMHAIIRPVDEGFEIVDFGSRNGVFVNRRRIREAKLLGHKDKVKIGKVKLKYKEPTITQGSSEAPPLSLFFLRHLEPRLQAAWIAFWGRIIAQTLGAIALIFLGLMIGGGLPSGCSPFGAQPSDGSAAPKPERSEIAVSPPRR